MLERWLDTLAHAGPWLIPLLGALAFSGRVVAFLVQEALQEKLYVPAWIEAVAPAKGRWLGLLLALPALMLTFVTVLIGAYLPLVFCTSFSWPLGLIASGGLLGLSLLIRAAPAPELRA